MRYKKVKIALAVVVALPVVLLGGIYGALRSEGVVKGYLFPYLSKQLGVPLTVDSVDIHPLSEIALQGLRYDCEGSSASCPNDKPLALQVGSLRVAYDLRAILSRELRITSLELKTPRVSMRAGANKDADSATSADAGNEGKDQGDASDPASAGFRVSIALISLNDGRFAFKDASGSSSYELEDLSIQAPQIHSHGEGEVKIGALATVKTEGLSVDKQELSIAGKLRDSISFQPTALDLTASIGAGADPLVRIAGELLFQRAPYSLRTISVREGTIRDSLLRTLAIPVEPVREFEYDLRGSYTLSNPADFSADIAVHKNVFSAPEVHDLKDSKLSLKGTLASDSVKLSSGSLELVHNNASIIKADLSGDLALDPYQRPSEISIRSSFADLGALRMMLQGISPEKPAGEAAAGSVDSGSKAPAAEPKADPLSGLKLPLGKLSLVIDKAIVQHQDATPLRAEIIIPSTRTIQKASVDATFSQGGTVAVNASGSLDAALNLKTQARNVNMIPFAALASGSHGELVEGSLTSADVDITALGRDLRKTLNGSVNLKISKMIVPSTLQQQVPFNILFIPFDALIGVFGGTLNLILPKSISSISDSIRQTLDKSGRLGLDESTVDLRFEQGKVLFKNVDINTKNLPDFTIKGNISAEDRLDLTVFIGLLKLNLPLPIAGSTSAPLPDVVYLGPELVRGLGMSVGNINPARVIFEKNHSQ